MSDFDTPTELDASPDKPLLQRVPWGTLALIAAMVGLWAWMGRTAPTPPVFSEGVALNAAVASAEEEGEGLVFAVATADWCAPCQSYKRGALRDPRVEAWVKRNATPVYINVDEAPEDAAALGVQSIPATFLLRDGRVVASASGALGADRLLDWLDQAAAQ